MTRLGSISATSSAIRPYWGVALASNSFLYVNETGRIFNNALLADAMSLMLSLKRRGGLAGPGCPVELTNTAEPEGLMVAPLMPLMNVAPCEPCEPIRIVFVSLARPTSKMWILLLPVVRLAPALTPMAML